MLKFSLILFPMYLPLYAFSRHALQTLPAFAGAALIAACTLHHPDYALTFVNGYLPALQFSLTGSDGKPVSANALRGKVVMVYFGYTHCPDVCPTTMARLTQAVQMLGADARDVRIVFISVDPARDTPQLMQSYAAAFDPQHAIGLTGNVKQIRELARRYRIAYQPGPPDPHGGYEVAHSSAVYLFDRQGRAQLMASAHDNAERIAHDLRQLLQQTS